MNTGNATAQKEIPPAAGAEPALLSEMAQSADAGHCQHPQRPAEYRQNQPPPGHTVNGPPGSFRVEFTLYNPDKTQFRALTGLVDTRVFESVVPAALLAELGIAPEKRLRQTWADGSAQVKDAAFVPLTLHGIDYGADVVFGTDAAAIIIGRMTLESFALAADAGRQQLTPALVTV